MLFLFQPSLTITDGSEDDQFGGYDDREKGNEIIQIENDDERI